MRIAILSPPWFPVPPTGYGGIEWIVSLLADGLAKDGHDVTLFASGDSRTKAKLAWVYEHAPSDQIGRSLPDLRHVLSAYERAEDFDVINDHTGHVGAVLGGLVETPVVHTVHGPLDGEPGDVYESIKRVAPKVGLISLSLNQRRPRPDLNWVANIPNALDLDTPVPAAGDAPAGDQAASAPYAAPSPLPDEGAASPSPAPPAVAEWVAELWVDPDWYRTQNSPDPLPSPGLPQIVALRKTSVLVGRASNSRGIHPEIDCGADSGVSRRHAQLTSDGSRWFVEDLQSSNGTFVGSSAGPLPTEPIAPGNKTELQADDRVYVGGWTRIVVRRATDDEGR